MSVLEDFYYGNIVPYEREYRSGSPQKNRQKQLTTLEAQLGSTLTAESLKLFRSFTEICTACQNDIALDAFITGFRIGAQLTYDAFVSDEAPLKNV